MTTQNIRMGNLRIRERLLPLKNDTANYERLAEELIRNEILSFKRMYLKDRKIENIMLIGDFITDTVFRDTEDKASRTISRSDFDAWYQNIVEHSTMELAVTMDVPVGIRLPAAPLRYYLSPPH